MARRVFKDSGVDHGFAAEHGVTDAVLIAAALEIDSGLIDARLGGFLLKRRVAMPGYDDDALAEIIADGDLLEIVSDEQNS